MDHEELINKLEKTGNYRVIKRFFPKKHYNQNIDNSPIKIGLYLDVETTGMNYTTDDIIEIAIVPFEFNDKGEIFNILPSYTSFNDPKVPISENIIQITKITNKMVKGKSIDIEKVKQMLQGKSIVIAHNAAFDRPFCEKLTDEFSKIPWACSMADINWKIHGIESVKLEYIAYKYDFFYEGHRAETDCLAGIEILSRKLPDLKETCLNDLLNNSKRVDIRVWAKNAPFDKKDILKKWGYRWNSKNKTWFIDIPEDNLEEEISKLNHDIYDQKIPQLPLEKFDAKKRYSTLEIN